MSKRFIFAVLLALLALALPVAAHLEDHAGYMVAPDANGVHQIWQISPDGGEPEQITNVQSSVVDFAFSPDKTLIAYTSEQTLWIIAGDDSAPQALAELSGDDPAYPVFNSDATQIAYADNGVWVVSLDGGEPRQLVENIPLPDYGPDMYDHYFTPTAFVDEANALIVNIRLWEGISAGVIDLETGALQELPRDNHSRLLPLSNGQVLVYGNDGVTGEFNLQLASIDDLQTRELLLDFATLDQEPLYASQAVEIEPGIVRVLGTTFGETPDTMRLFVMDVDSVTGELLSNGVITFLPEQDGQFSFGPLSPDGSLLPQYLNVSYNPNGITAEEIIFYALPEGTPSEFDLPFTFSVFDWQ